MSKQRTAQHIKPKKPHINTFFIHGSTNTPRSEIVKMVKGSTSICPLFLKMEIVSHPVGYKVILTCKKKCNLCVAPQNNLMKNGVYIKPPQQGAEDGCIQVVEDDCPYQMIRVPKNVKIELSKLGLKHHKTVYWRAIKFLLTFYKEHHDEQKSEDEEDVVPMTDEELAAEGTSIEEINKLNAEK